MWKAHFRSKTTGQSLPVVFIYADTIEAAFDDAEKLARREGVELIEVSDR